MVTQPTRYTARPVRIVIADDHALMCEGIRSMLSPPHTIVGTVHDGRDVPHTVSTLGPDLLLLDISLPGVNGLVLLRELRAELPELKVVMLTMHTERVYAEEALAAGAHGYLLKSSGSTELRFAVEEVMAGRQYVTPLVRPGPGGGPGGEPGDVTVSPPAASALTPRQREVLTLLAQGLSTAEIAARLGISVKTVEFHRHAIRQELGLTSQAALVRFAVAAGLVEA
ncbi:MAG TPA: response regulator transcription factor [Gemmatimonadales bacterium]|nr:response regulator transcription factor [Gemmatimonadales bacterium]